MSKKNKNYSNDKFVDFGGWESEEEKLKRNLQWTPEQILNWLQEANEFNKAERKIVDVLR